MTTLLSSLRVTSEMDASQYVAGAAAVEAANQRMADSGKAAGLAMAQYDASLERSGGTLVSLSKNVAGYGDVSRFSTQVRQLQTQFEQGGQLAGDPNKLARTAEIYDALTQKAGLYADATKLVGKNNADFAALIDSLNAKAAARIDIIGRETVAIDRMAQAQASSQIAILKSIGATTPGSGAGSAQTSADAFLSGIGGLDGVAQARAQQTAKAFTDELDTRLIAGTAKSARDSAAVFQEEMQRLDDIAKLKAQQVGQNFQQDLNASFGIGGQSKSARDSAGVFQEADQQAQALEDLRNKYDPLHVAQQRYAGELADINKLYVAGKLDQTAYIGAIATSEDTYKKTTTEATALAGGHATAMGGMTTQAAALAAALRHMFDAMAAGMSPMRVIMMEFGNMSYGLSGSGALMGVIKGMATSIGGFFASAIGMAIGLIGSLVLAFGGAAAAGMSWASSQRTVMLALTGIGGASGATVKGINNIAAALADSSKISISEATHLATTLAGTGKVGMEMIGQLIVMNKNFAATFGITNAKAADMLARVFSDPAKGAEELNARLGLLNPALERHLKELVDTNRVGEAQKLLAEAVNTQMANASTVTGTWSKAWDSLTNSISSFWTRLGKGTDSALGLNVTIEDQYSAAQEKVKKLEDQLNAAQPRPSGPQLLGDPGFLKNQSESISKIKADLVSAVEEAHKFSYEMERSAFATHEASLNIQAMREKLTVSTLMPDTGVKSLLATNLENAQNIAANTELQKKYNITQADANRMVDQAKTANDSFIPSMQKRLALSELERLSVDAQAPGQKAAIAAQKMAIDLSGKEGEGLDKATKARLAANAAYQASGGIVGALTQQKEHISLLGDLATALEVARAKTIDLQIANLKLDPKNKLTEDQISKLQLASAAQDAQNRVNAQATAGVFDLSRAQQAANLTLQHWIDIGAVDKNNIDQMSAAMNVLRKQIKDTSDQSKVAGSMFPNFTRASLDARDLYKSLDTLAVSGIDHLADSLVSVIDGTAKMGDAFRALGKVVVGELEKMIIKMMLYQTLSAFGLGGGKGLLSFLGLANGGVVNNGTVGGTNGGLGPMYAAGAAFNRGMIYPYALGGIASDIITSPTLFRMATGTGLMGEAGPEAVMPLTRINGRLGVQAAGGAGPAAPVITQNIYVTGATGNAEVEKMVASGVRQANAQSAALFKQVPTVAVNSVARARSNNPRLFG